MTKPHLNDTQGWLAYMIAKGHDVQAAREHQKNLRNWEKREGPVRARHFVIDYQRRHNHR